MPSVSRSRLITTEPASVWSLVADPHNLPRWWPDTVRVEDVDGEAGEPGSRFTQVLSTSKGTPVRADYVCERSVTGRSVLWRQELAGTPFEGFMRSSELEVSVEPGEGGALVVVAGRRRLRGMSRFGGPLMRRATVRTIDAALDGIADALTTGPRDSV